MATPTDFTDSIHPVVADYRKRLADRGLFDDKDDLQVARYLAQQNPALLESDPSFGQLYGQIREVNAPSLMEEGTRAFKRAGIGLGSTALGGAALLTGSDYLRRKSAALGMQASDPDLASTIPTLEDIQPGRDGAGQILSRDALRYGISKVGEAAPSLGEAVALGLIGGAIGSAVEPGAGTAVGAAAGVAEGIIGRGIIRKAIQSLVAKGAAEDALIAGLRKGVPEVVEAVTKNAKAIAGARAGTVAAGVNSYLLNAGEVYGENDDRATAAGLGLIAAIPDTVLPALVVRRMFPGVSLSVGREAAKEVVGENAMKVAKAAGVTAFEGGTESFQQAVNIVARNLKDGVDPFTVTDADKISIREAGIAGTVGGALASPAVVLGSDAPEVIEAPVVPTPLATTPGSPLVPPVAPIAPPIILPSRRVRSMTPEAQVARLAELETRARVGDEEAEYQILLQTVPRAARAPVTPAVVSAVAAGNLPLAPTESGLGEFVQPEGQTPIDDFLANARRPRSLASIATNEVPAELGALHPPAVSTPAAAPEDIAGQEAAAQRAEADAREYALPLGMAGAPIAPELETPVAPEVLSAYQQLPAAREGRYISTDLARTLIPGFSATNPTATNAEASAIAAEAFAAGLANPAVDRVTLMAGGAGSGKSTAKGHVTPSELVYDGVFGSADSLRRLDQAVESGKPVRVLYVYRPLPQAVEGVLTRKTDKTPVVPAEVIVNGHLNATQNFLTAAEKYADNPNVDFVLIDNSGERTDVSIVDDPVAFLRHAAATTQSREKLIEETRNAPAAARLSEAEKTVFLAGAVPADGQEGAAGADVVEGGLAPAVTPESLPDANKAADIVWYHGTGANLETDKVASTWTKTNSLFGTGFYLTDNPEIANSYGRNRGGKGGKTYAVRVAPRAVLNLELPMTEAVADVLTRSVYDDFKDVVSDGLAENKTTAQVISDLREAVADQSQGDMIPESEYGQMFQEIEGNFREAGIDAFTHVGGTRAGKGKKLHRVLIMLDPSNEFGVAGGGNPKTVLDVRDNALPPPPLVGIEKNMPQWAREEMAARGLDPARPLNDVDTKNASVRAAVESDPTLTPEQKARTLETGSPAPAPTAELRKNNAGIDLPPVSSLSAPQKLAELQQAGIKTYAGKPIGDANPAQLSNALGKFRRGEIAAEAPAPARSNTLGDQIVKIPARVDGQSVEVEMTAKKAEKMLSSRVEVMQKLLACLGT